MSSNTGRTYHCGMIIGGLRSQIFAQLAIIFPKLRTIEIVISQNEPVVTRHGDVSNPKRYVADVVNKQSFKAMLSGKPASNASLALDNLLETTTLMLRNRFTGSVSHEQEQHVPQVTASEGGPRTAKGVRYNETWANHPHIANNKKKNRTEKSNPPATKKPKKGKRDEQAEQSNISASGEARNGDEAKEHHPPSTKKGKKNRDRQDENDDQPTDSPNTKKGKKSKYNRYDKNEEDNQPTHPPASQSQGINRGKHAREITPDQVIPLSLEPASRPEKRHHDWANEERSTHDQPSAKRAKCEATFSTQHERTTVDVSPPPPPSPQDYISIKSEELDDEGLGVYDDTQTQTLLDGDDAHDPTYKEFDYVQRKACLYVKRLAEVAKQTGRSYVCPSQIDPSIL